MAIGLKFPKPIGVTVNCILNRIDQDSTVTFHHDTVRVVGKGKKNI